ncbi:MAG: CopG family transcriptional regulator [Thermoprotei archaeon]|nr:MAG: CopG family transcriptional regulator [Thermoprotei archaeon]RLF18971.1 MAG: CopG family transcriptional regulator [Thermoprotei archaeon]
MSKEVGGEKIPVYISRELYDRVKKFIEEQGGFSSVEEFVEFVLNEVISEEGTEYTLSKEDEEKIKERLRSLGYI